MFSNFPPNFIAYNIYRLDPASQYCLLFFYGLTFLLGLIGNMAIVLAMLMDKVSEDLVFVLLVVFRK